MWGAPFGGGAKNTQTLILGVVRGDFMALGGDSRKEDLGHGANDPIL